jgi:hypothetical protein
MARNSMSEKKTSFLSIFCLALISLWISSIPVQAGERDIVFSAGLSNDRFNLKLNAPTLLPATVFSDFEIVPTSLPAPVNTFCSRSLEKNRKTACKKNSSESGSKRFKRALLVDAALLIPNSIKYWIKYSDWIEDWQFELTWEDQKKRFFSLDAYLFDSNPFVTNWTHTVAGAVYYDFARYHRLNKLESTLFMLGSSMWWEYITEWREVISVGDNICSGVAGITIGEPLYWIGSYFTQKKGLGNTILGFIFNPIVGINDLLDNKKHMSLLNLQRFPRPDFNLFFGPQMVSDSENDSGSTRFFSGLSIRYYTIEGYGESGKQNRYIKSTLFSEFQADVSLGVNTLEEYSFFTRSILFGQFRQNLKQHSDNKLSGHNLILGAATAFDYYKKNSTRYYDKGEYHYDFTGGEEAPQPVEFSDKIAIMNLIGPVAEFSHYSDQFKFRTSVSAYLDFALVTSMAINKYSSLYDLYDPRIKTTLSYYGYYYAFGFTVFSDMDLIYGNIKLSGKLKYHWFDSIEGLDRFQEDMEDDSNVSDTRLMAKIGLGFSLPDSPITLQIAYEYIDRKGQFKDVSHAFSEERLYARINVSL